MLPKASSLVLDPHCCPLDTCKAPEPPECWLACWRLHTNPLILYHQLDALACENGICVVDSDFPRLFHQSPARW